MRTSVFHARVGATRMSLELCVLASGSSGNCTVVRAPTGVMLIDAGLGPRVTARRMNGTGVRVRDVRAICLTHLDSDHFRHSWLATIARQGIRVFCHESRTDDLLRGATADTPSYDYRRRCPALVPAFNRPPVEPLEGLSARASPAAYDR